MNKQPIEKRDHRDDDMVDVFDIFGPTFQGEGPFVGQRCVFVRLAGCNLQCPGCDTIYTGTQRKLMSPGEIIDKIYNLIVGIKGSGNGKLLIVISGGEPFRQNIGPLLTALYETGNFFIQIETNGTLPRIDENNYGFGYNSILEEKGGVYVVCSPKTGKVDKSIAEVVCAYKYVGAHDTLGNDGLPMNVLQHTAPVRGVARPHEGFDGPVYLNPTDHSFDADADGLHELEANRQSLEAVKASCIKHGYILGVQLHKIIGVE